MQPRELKYENISQYNQELLQSIGLSIDVVQSVNSWIEYYTTSHHVINYGTKQYITGDKYTIDIDEFEDTTLDFITLENMYHELLPEEPIEQYRSAFVRLMLMRYPRMKHICFLDKAF